MINPAPHRPKLPLARILALTLAALVGWMGPGSSLAHADEAPREDAPEVETLDPKAHAKELIAQFKADSAADREAAAKAAVENTHSSLFSPLTKLLLDKDAQVRMAAFDALETRVGSDKKKASKHLVARLSKWEKASRDDFTRALEVIGTLGDPAAAKPILDAIKVDSLRESVEARFEAVSRIPDGDVFERLVQFLARGRRGDMRWQRNLCVNALKRLTGQRYGHDPDAWRRWWKAEGKDIDLLSVKVLADEQESERAESQERKRERRRQRDETERGGSSR